MVPTVGIRPDQVADRFNALIEVLAAREANTPQRLPETTSDHGGLQS